MVTDADESSESPLSHPKGSAGAEDGRLPLFVIDEMLFPGVPAFTADEAATNADVDPVLARRLWRAMGFTEMGGGDVAFYDRDVRALALARDEVASGVPLDSLVRQTRVISSAVSRIAETSADEIVAGLLLRRHAGASDDEVEAWLRMVIDVDSVERLLGYFFRRQLRAALWRKLAVPAELVGGHRLTVGFVDLVRFTALTEDVPEDELDSLVSRFEEVAHDRITAVGGRVVKMIGDEVMFVADEPFVGVTIALDLVEAYSADERLPPARAGIASGDVLSRDGDYFGPVVNLASRIVDVARPKAVVTSDALRETLAENEELAWRHLPPKRLKGIGRSWLWSVRRKAHTTA